MHPSISYSINRYDIDIDIGIPIETILIQEVSYRSNRRKYICIMAKNCRSLALSAIVGLFVMVVAMAEETIELPSTYEDDLYHCKDPTLNQNPIRCDPTTFLWDIGDLTPSVKPDDSLLCQEIVKILVRAREEEGLEPGQPQEKETEREVQLWETIMKTSVVDQLEPCVLWAMSYGPLTPWAFSMGFDESRYQQNQVTFSNNGNFDINENGNVFDNAGE